MHIRLKSLLNLPAFTRFPLENASHYCDLRLNRSDDDVICDIWNKMDDLFLLFDILQNFSYNQVIHTKK